jgi:TIR domain
MVKFMNHFVECLRVRLGASDAEEIAKLVFFDFRSLRAGEEWSESLTQALCEARAFVCLVSPTYLNSAWCGRELEAFHRRYEGWKAVAPVGVGGRFIFPVIWQPDDKRGLPSKIARFQYQGREISKHYERLGLRQLADLSRFRQDFKQFVDDLAKEVAAAMGSDHMLPPAVLSNLDDIPSAFLEKPLPYDVFLLAATPGGDSWKPTPSSAPVAAAASRAAAAMRVFLYPFRPEQDLENQVERLCRDRQILLALVDADSAPGSEIEALNKVAAAHSLALLAIDTKVPPGSEPRKIEQWLRALPEGNFHRAARKQYASCCLPSNLAAEIERVVTRVRLSLILEDPAAKVEDAEIVSSAQADGIPTKIRATLSGPGQIA